MATWGEVEALAPDLAQDVRRCFAVRKHATLATLRRDGSPRISGTEVEFAGAEIYLSSMPAAVKALDLQRDGRFALHSPTVDPPEEDPGAWGGEAKVAGFAHEVGARESASDPHRFRLDVREVVLTRVTGNRLVVTSWHPDRGVVVRSRD